MSFWEFFGPQRFTITYPLVTLNGNLTDGEIQMVANALGRAEPRQVAACMMLVHDQTPPRVAIHFGAGLGITERQGQAIAHELNHVLSQLQKVPDETHAVDGGVLQGERAMPG